MAQPKPTGEIQNPNPGDNVVSTGGIIKVTIASDGSLPVTKLFTNKRGSSIFSCTTQAGRSLTRLFFEPMIRRCLLSARFLSQAAETKNSN